MFRLLILLLGVFLFSSAFFASASLHSFSQLSSTQLLAQAQGGEWYPCSENDDPKWCRDGFSYYQQSYYAELTNDSNGMSLTLYEPYSQYALSEFQLNLRRDGFQLECVTIDTHTFQVAQALAEAETQAEINDLDKQLVLFLNRYQQHAPRVMEWFSERWKATLISDGEMISIEFVESEVAH
ncbi:hypothetical protein [Vibrio atypicus]|uniref:hypothetical protein n=1 Tax=Vibrio atypicus TaxID=558271 RepID=UPI003736FDDB